MPWKPMQLSQERLKFAQSAERAERPFSRLCQDFGISRQTGYKWLSRHREDPRLEALSDRSRAPHWVGNETDPRLAEEICRTRKRFPFWGPIKLRAWLMREQASIAWPTASTIGRILKRAGLVKPPKRRVKTPPYTRPFAKVTAPNQLWCVDFKGWFRTKDGKKVYPLTLTDAYSRYLLRVEIVLKPDTAAVRAVFESAFRDYGLPEAIRSDNGAPFASRAPGGLTELSAWWARLGIRHERIEPGKPQQNGRHERMHLTLKREACTPASCTWPAQQAKFNRFRAQYNEERPHAGIDNRLPAELYLPSSRVYSQDLRREIYEIFGVESLPVSKMGNVRWMGRTLHVGRPLREDLVEVRMVARDRRWSFSYGPVLLGYFNAKTPARGLIRIKRPIRVSAMSSV